MALPEGISDAFPLTPAQKGILFHVLEVPSARGRYVAVLNCLLKGPLDARRLQNALQASVNSRDAYRAGFVWEGMKNPVQLIHRSVNVPWTDLDWTEETDVEQRLDRLVQMECLRHFDLKRAPLMHVTLVRLSDQSHRLVWTIHHLISDAWSTGVVLESILNTYATGSSDAAVAAQFRDHLTWLQNSNNQTDTEFWTGHFSGLEGASEVDVTATGEVTYSRQNHISQRLKNEVVERVGEIARELRVTQNTVLSGVWGLVLRRLSGKNDIVFGQTFSGRSAPVRGVDRAAGAFINTLPIRLVIDPDETIQDFLRRAGRLQQGLRRQEFANLSEVQAHAPIPKGKALFDTLFVNEGVAEHQKEFGSIRLTDVKTVQSSNYAMAMLVMPGKDATAELYFDTAKVSPEAAQRCMDLYNETLRAVPEEPERTIRELSWQGTRNLTVPPAKQYQDVVTRFLRCATEQPESVAISDESGSLTYAELAIRSRKIAGKLRNAGVRSGDLVPVAVSRGTDTVAAFLGVMLTGAAYVPIDLSYPRNRIAQILERVSPRHIITDCSDLTTLPIQNGRIVHIDGLPEPLPAEEIQLGPIAYVIFTSGSQGQPKGVQISHRALAHSTGVRDAVYGAPPSVYLLLSSFAFDSSVAGIYWTLTTRGTLIIAPKHIEQDPADFGRLVAENSVSHTLCLPSLLQAIIEAVPSQKLQCLGTVITAGEPLTHALVNLSKNALPNCRIFNEYGPTEATVWCTVYEATDSGGSGTVPIGSALPGVLAEICDPDGVLLPNGEVGEICIAGPTLAEGYLNDPALTRQSFVETGPSDMLAYHTGDLGVADEDGAINFLGRLDGQIKIRGHRVELGEIEAVAQEVLPGVEIAAVVTEMAHRKTIVLCVQDTANEDVSKSLWEAFQRSLPDYCHPKQLLFLSAFPRLPNGKVDRRELKWSAVSAASERCAGAAPQSDIEMQVADIFGEVLGVSERSREMHFFDFGGDSLKTIAVYSKARDQGLCIEATDVFENPTVRELAAQIQKRAVNEPRDVSNGVLRQANQRGDKTAVFVLHGTSDIFDQLVLKLGDRHPVGMLYSHFLHSESPPFSVTIEDLAAEAMAALRRVRPHGPYTLCGYSAAVPAILEMAHQLGPGEVKEVLLFDPPYLVVARDSDWQSDPIASRHHRKMVNKVKKRIVRRSLRVPLLKLNTWLRPNNKRIKDKSVRWAYDFAVSRYRLRKHDQPVQVFLSDGNPCLEKGSAFDKTLLDRTVHELKMSHKDIVESKHGASEFVKHIVSHSK